MFVFAALGLIALVVVFYGMKAFGMANAGNVASALRWGGVVIAAGVGLYLTLTGRFAFIVGLLPLALPWVAKLRSDYKARGGGKSPAGRSSKIETRYLRASLDLDTGIMEGVVLEGRARGRRLAELNAEELLALLAECRIEDPQSAAILEAYLNRTEPEWQAKAAGGGNRGSAAPAMTPDEARHILGLDAGAGPAEVKDAHRRLMAKLHPDTGGSTYLASKINQARDILLQG